MRRVEKLAAHLRADEALRDCRVVLGSLGDTKLPAIMVNQTNHPYDDEGFVILDAEEPRIVLVQLDGWIEGETYKQTKKAAYQLCECLTAAVNSFTKSPNKLNIFRSQVRSTRRDRELWRITLNVALS